MEMKAKYIEGIRKQLSGLVGKEVRIIRSYGPCKVGHVIEVGSAHVKIMGYRSAESIALESITDIYKF